MTSSPAWAPETDRSGKPGVNQAKVDQFFAEAQAYSDWWKKAEADPAILPLGRLDACRRRRFQAVKAKVDDYFTRCRLAAFDPRAVSALNREEKEYLAFAAKDLTLLPPRSPLSPWRRWGRQAAAADRGPQPGLGRAIAKFDAEVVRPICSAARTALTEADWAADHGPVCSLRWPGWRPRRAPRLRSLVLRRVREILAGRAGTPSTGSSPRTKPWKPEFERHCRGGEARPLPSRPLQAAATTSSPSAISTAARTRRSSRPARSTWTSEAATSA